MNEYAEFIRYHAVMDTLTVILGIIVVICIWYGATRKKP